MKLKKILNNIPFKGTHDNREILNIAHDSRKVKKGTLFIAIAGENNDGHDFIFDALDKGAIAVVANGRSPITDLVPILQVKNPRKIMSKIAANFFNNPSKDLNIIGITGTNGKTSTTLIINEILKKCNKNSSSLGTLGFSTPAGIVSTGFTTPESIDLHQILKTLKDGGIEYIPMEVSSHAIDMHRIDDIKFKIGIFTNLSNAIIAAGVTPDILEATPRVGGCTADSFSTITSFENNSITLFFPFIPNSANASGFLRINYQTILSIGIFVSQNLDNWTQSRSHYPSLSMGFTYVVGYGRTQ